MSSDIEALSLDIDGMSSDIEALSLNIGILTDKDSPCTILWPINSV
jgi:hypothetical protein